MEVIVISNTVQKFNGESFYLCGSYFQHKGKRLHRTVWEYHYGEIPKGYHVHHKDENKSNNDISNLALLKGSDHMRGHITEEKKEYARKNIKRAIAAAPKWHHSEEGKRWHSINAKAAWLKKQVLSYDCTYCGKIFYTKNTYEEGANHFCSNNCKAAYRRKLGVDNVKRICPVCGKAFVVNKYSKNITCSRECGKERRWGASK